VTDPPPDVRWQALLVGVASNAHFLEDPDDGQSPDPQDPGFVQSLNSQAEFANALERNMPGLHEDDLIVLPEPRFAHEVTDAIAQLNQAHDDDGDAGLVRPGLLFYYCGHGMNVREHLYLSTVETIDNNEASRRRTGLALSDVLATIAETRYKRPRVALILDCCFAGLACEEPDETGVRRPHLLMAVRSKEKAEHDPDSTGPTYFTGALAELMRGGDPEAGPWIDLETALRWLEPRLVARHGEKRRPIMRVGERGPIVLGGNNAYSDQPARR
jgi:Caspase domain